MSATVAASSDGRHHPTSSRQANLSHHDLPRQPETPRSASALALVALDKDYVASDSQIAGHESLPSSTAPTSIRPIPIRSTRSPSKDAPASKEAVPPVRASPPVSSANLDPLSQHILLRTNTEHASSPRLRYPGRPESPAPDGVQRLGSDIPVKHAGFAPTDGSRDKKKGVSFLSRLSMRGRKKEDEFSDDVSELGEPRLSGTNARVFASAAIGSGGFIPHHKEPPRYIRVRAHNKKTRDFNRMFLAQELLAPPHDTTTEARKSCADLGAKKRPQATGAVWAAEFSKDGKYLAAAGKDGVVRIWAVISTPEERRHHEEGEATADGSSEARLSAPVFQSQPIREFEGHTSDVLDLSWSKNNFLLSSSMDKTVRLWHATRQECLCTFKHKDFVTSIAFHPTDDRFFLAGSLDAHLRLWSIPDKAVAYTAQLPDIITAVAFSPDGKTSIGGVLNGTCLFYETEGLQLQSQMVVRSSRGKNAKGSKITGIKTMVVPPHDPHGEVKVLITSNDSRIRMYNMKDKTIELKLKGHENQCSQIHANFSDDAQWVICGSEDKKAFMWSMNPADLEKVPNEHFEAHSARVSVALFAPTKSRQLLSESGDPLYDLCNPPPVKLMSLEESMVASQTALSEISQQPQPTQQPTGQNNHKEKPQEKSPQYLEKSKHPDGNILITADQTGVIKVFRQDCAHVKRRHENWETGSSFSRKLINSGTGMVGRSGSIITRTSASSHPHSRRTSVSQPHAGTAVQPGGTTPQMSSDRINSWRQGVGVDSNRSSMIGGAGGSMRSERSASPTKMSRAVQPPASLNLTSAASEARKQPYVASPSQARGPHPSSPSSSVANSPRMAMRKSIDNLPSHPPTPSFSFKPADEEDHDPDSTNHSFWNLNRWRAFGSSSPRLSSGPSFNSLTLGAVPIGATSNKRRSAGPGTLSAIVSGDSEATESSRRRSTGVRDGDDGDDGAMSKDDGDGDGDGDNLLHTQHTLGARSRLNSVISRLTIEYTSDEGEPLACPKCGSIDFKTKRMAGRERLVCEKCGKVLEDSDH